MFKYNREDLIKQIARHEGIVLKVYKDSLGIDTIGIGRNLAHRGIEVVELAHMQKSMSDIFKNGITKEDAYFLANRDIKIVEEELLNSRTIVKELDAIRQRVLVDMGFNMGIPRLNKFFLMWSAIDKQEYKSAAEEMQDSLWAGQVKSRADTLAYAMEHGEFA
jgi:lysozyme|tara:strand:- start:785 stop:1273 length:489 start_codon:yes stop_codon:yes gene_type:complete